MAISRRTFLRTVAVAGTAAPLFGCEHAVSQLTERMGQTIPGKVKTFANPQIDPAFHLMSRAAYGPWPGDIEKVQGQGLKSWIEEQLHPESIDDQLCDLRSRRFETIHLDGGTCFEFKKHVLREELMRYALIKAVYSKRQLFEVMVGFWSDHLNINIEKGDCIYLKPQDDRKVVRAHALGNFRDLIRASLTSPAMLVYLDGNQNKKEDAKDIPNENYARELLELHTMGVHGGYTQQDVFEVARALTGWRIRSDWQRGTVYFDRNLHDDEPKTILGHVLNGWGGEKDADEVVDIVCKHPSTALHISRKLCQKFVGEMPPQSVVASASTEFTRTRGDIKSVVRTILNSDEFKAARATKLKRPFHFIASALRMTGADTYAHQELIEYLMRMGQGPYQYPTPDGYPDEATPWVGSLLWRWNFAMALASNSVPSVQISVDRLSAAIGASADAGIEPMMAYLIGRKPSRSELAPFTAREGQRKQEASELLGLMLSSPAFQRC